MLSFQLLEYSQEVLQALKYFRKSASAVELFNYVMHYDAHRDAINRHILFEATLDYDHNGAFSYNGDGGALRSRYSDAIGKFRKNTGPFDLKNSFDAMKNRIIDCKSKYDISDAMVGYLFEKADAVIETYDRFLRTTDTADGYYFSESALNFFHFFTNTENHYNSYAKMISPPEQCDTTDLTTKKELEIQMLGVEYSYKDFIKLLNAVNIIYDELRLAMYDDAQADDLSIIKVESGSAGIILRGADRIIKVLVKYLDKTLDLLFSKFTKEGQILRLADVRTELRKDAELFDFLKDKGLDTPQAKENIERTFIRLTEETYRLATAAPRIKVNGKEHSIEQHKRQEYLKEIKTLHITDSENIAE